MEQEKHTWINNLGRLSIIVLLGESGFACYDHEDTEDLRMRLRENIMDGTIDMEDMEVW